MRNGRNLRLDMVNLTSGVWRLFSTLWRTIGAILWMLTKRCFGRWCDSGFRRWPDNPSWVTRKSLKESSNKSEGLLELREKMKEEVGSWELLLWMCFFSSRKRTFDFPFHSEWLGILQLDSILQMATSSMMRSQTKDDGSETWSRSLRGRLDQGWRIRDLVRDVLKSSEMYSWNLRCMQNIRRASQTSEGWNKGYEFVFMSCWWGWGWVKTFPSIREASQ